MSIQQPGTPAVAAVRVWEEDQVIPTYKAGEPDKNPMFLEKRVYQGSSGRVYPHPVIDKIADEKTDVTYRLVILENEYVRIEIMPEIGGRIYRALDKTNNYDFVYYNRVIKPALVGLAGPWISGGIEFNWPQHHRPNTFGPVEYRLEQGEDGSATVWVSEIDRMNGTKVTAGFTLHPGKAYLEISAQLYNRTAEPQTFLWWANPAVAVNDYTQSVFPPDVTAVFDHGKRDVSRFPIATGTYYKMDYSAGVDISRYKNIPVPTSYMAYKSDYNFVGGYDHGVGAGLLHVANHHISPGKKQWTWGNGEFGQAWDRNLTDEDGPYIELMTGVYTDNQPDFTWLAPYEEKTFTQYFMPYKEIGIVKNASIEAAVNLEIDETARTVAVLAYATSVCEEAVVELKGSRRTYVSDTVLLSPVSTYKSVVALDEDDRPHDLLVTIRNAEGRMLISYRPAEPSLEQVPDAAKPLPKPEELKTNEQLYLAGLHLEQYRHATFEPEAYYLEGLKRDESDIRINVAYGTLMLRRGRFAEAERHFRRAVKSLTWRNPNPYDSEAYYQLGMALKLQNRRDEAFAAFYKAVWSGAWQDSGYFELAAIACGKGSYAEALELVERSLTRGSRNYKARHLKAVLLRKLGRPAKALGFAEETLQLDPADFAAESERWAALLELGEADKAAAVLAELTRFMRGDVHNVLQLAADYIGIGLFAEAVQVMERILPGAYSRGASGASTGFASGAVWNAASGGAGGSAPQAPAHDLRGSAAQMSSGIPEMPGAIYPLLHYTLAYAHERAGHGEAAALHRQAGKAAPADYCFPNSQLDLLVLEAAVLADPADAKAHYYLGNWFYDKKQAGKAIEHWEKSRSLDSCFPTVHRNLALAYYNKRNDAGAALQSLEQAFAVNPADARVFYELDQLYKKLGYSALDRLAKLEQHKELVIKRDDLYLEFVTLLNSLGRYEEALQALAERIFHPWEGGEGKVTGQYVFAHVELAKQALREKKYERAAELLEQALHYPHNLGEGKLDGAQENNIYYYLGSAYEGLGLLERAAEYWSTASRGLEEPAGAMYYNDQPPDMIYYQGLAWRKLQVETEAKRRFNKLMDYAEKHLFDEVEFDYFAVSLPDFLVFEDDLNKRNEIHCRYMRGLGLLGLGRREEAQSCFLEVLRLDSSHQGAMVHLRLSE